MVTPRPSEGPIVQAAEARAAATRATAARWHWVTERWHASGPEWQRRTAAPERYHWAKETLLDGVRKVRAHKLEGEQC